MRSVSGATVRQEERFERVKEKGKSSKQLVNFMYKKLNLS